MNHLFAWAVGYFWLPCPLCCEMFGGHEGKVVGDVVACWRHA